MEQIVVALSTDLALISALNKATEDKILFSLTDDPDKALQQLSCNPIPTLFVDTRVSHFEQAATAVIQRLARGEVPAVNVLTLGDASYPASVAAELDLLEATHIRFQSAQQESLARVIAEATSQPFAVPTPESRLVESRNVSISTFTSGFFNVVDDILRVAAREVTLLLIGETGTGKTTLARFVHELSTRRDRQFQDLACGALPSDLIESELFGH
ncbi:MAG: sigma 54-interacting transcriptional regulator, partial [Planctomycetaceae bacterium]